MNRTKPIWERLYEDQCWIAVCREVGYFGCTLRELVEIQEKLATRFTKERVESAAYYLVTYEGQMTCNPKPLAKVHLRTEVRKVAYQLLGPPPEQWDQFYRNADGSPTPQHAAKMAELTERTGKKPEPPKKPPRKKVKA